MAKGAYVGVQGIAPDLRPSVQAAIENERANRQEKLQKEQYEYQKQQNEISTNFRERELDLKERELSHTLGVKDAAKRNQKFFQGYEKDLANAQSDIFSVAGNDCLMIINPMIESIASDRELAETGDMDTANQARLRAGKTKQTVINLATVFKSYEQIFGNDQVDNMFNDFVDFKGEVPKGYENIDQYLKGLVSSNWKLVNRNGQKVMSNGTLDVGVDSDGNIMIKTDGQTFSSMDAVHSHLNSLVIKKDSSYINSLNNLKNLSPVYQDIDNEFKKGRKYDFGLMRNNFDDFLKNTPLNQYKDNLTYTDAVNKGDAPLVSLFYEYGFDDDSNLKTVRDLKNAIWKRYSNKYHDTVTDKPNRTTPTVDYRSYDLTDTTDREQLLNMSKNSGHKIDNDMAKEYASIFPIGDAVNKLIAEKDMGALDAYDFNATLLPDGKIELSNTTESENKSGKSSRINAKFVVDPTDANDVEKLMTVLIENHNKKDTNNKITYNNVRGMFNFGGFESQIDEAKSEGIDEVINAFDNDKLKITNGAKFKDSQIPVHLKILQAIKQYIPDGFNVEVDKEPLGNGLTYKISHDDWEDAIDFYMNTNISHNTSDEDEKAKQVHTVLRKIKDFFANPNYDGNIWNKRSQVKPTASSNYGGGGSTIISTYIPSNVQTLNTSHPATPISSSTTTIINDNTGLD